MVLAGNERFGDCVRFWCGGLCYGPSDNLSVLPDFPSLVLFQQACIARARVATRWVPNPQIYRLRLQSEP